MGTVGHRAEGPLSPVRSSGTRAARALLVGLLLAASLTACGLIGGGEEALAEGELSEVDQLKLDVDVAEKQTSAERVRAAGLQGEIAGLKKQIADAAAQDASGLITLERARLEVIRHAQQNLTVYPAEYQSVSLVWEVFSAEEKDEFFYVTLTYRPFGEFSGQEGLEEFLVDKNGKIELRQILELPDAKGTPRVKLTEEPKPAEG